SVTDGSGNTTSGTQTVTVKDAEKPILSVPPDVTVNTAGGTCSALIAEAALAATATDNCTGVGNVVRTGAAADRIFPSGTTTVTYSVTDGSGNTTSGTQTVTVKDAEKPILSVPPDVTVNTAGGTCSA